MDEILRTVNTKNIIVDFHAEATSEKKSMAFYLAGRVSAVLGTHTHVQTADEQVIDGKTAFISDVGMVGAADSVIGYEKNAIRLFTDYYPQKFIESKGESLFNAVVVEIDTSAGFAKSIKRINKII
jgi:calcineurin-like phosphoesterase